MNVKIWTSICLRRKNLSAAQLPREHFNDRVFFQTVLTLLVLLFIYGIPRAQIHPFQGYKTLPWNSSFPSLEKTYPQIEFIAEDNFKVVSFSVSQAEPDIVRVEFKLFEERLFAVAHYFSHNIESYQTFQYIQKYLPGIGEPKETRKTTAQSLLGQANVIIWDYGDTLVFFRSYPSLEKTRHGKPENSIHFVWKATFEEMKRYHDEHMGEVFDDVEDADYICF